MMNSDDAVCVVIRALNQTQIPYMIVGSMSSNYYGVPRSTKDADFVIDVGGGQSVAAINPLLGAGFQFDPQKSFETATLSFRHIIKVTDISFTIELFYLSDDPHDRERFGRRRPEKFKDLDTWVPTPEDVIVTKLNWAVRLNRRKDIEDVRDVIAVQQSNLDWPYVESWCDRHGTRQLLEDIRQQVAGI